MKSKPRLQLSISNVLGVAIVLGLLSFALMNGAYGQVFDNNQGNSNVPSTSSFTLQQQPPKLHLVKITSPIKGQQVPIGKDLEISGTSKDNATTPDNCKVSIKLNANSYRDASASDSGGGRSDYSNWNFTLTPSYANMIEGQNKITAKFSCANNPNLISHNSVNVTGIAATSVAANNNDNGSGLQEQVSSTPAAPIEALNLTTNGTTTPLYSESTANNNINYNNLKNLSVTVHLDKDSLHPGDKQTLALDVVDENSTASISGASIWGKITGPSGVVKKVEGTTDDNGKASYSWKVNNDYPTGKYRVKIEVSNLGYENYSGSKSFKVTPIPVTTSNDNSIPQSNSPLVTIRHSTGPASDNTERHHHIRHTAHSTIISSFSPHTVTNTNTNTNTNTRTIIHISPSLLPGANANGGSDTNSPDHTLIVTPSSSSLDNTGVNTDSNGNQQASSITGGEKSNGVGSNILGGGGSSSSTNLGNNLGLQTDGLAQKIINDVKNKLERHGISLP